MNSMIRKIWRVLDRILSHHYFPVLSGIIAIAITFPTIWSGWYSDDYFHRLLFDNSNIEAAQLRSRVWPEYSPNKLLLNTYQFIDGKPESVEKLKDAGIIPWWSTNNLKVNYCRPLSSLFYLIDYRFWPNTPEFFHVHSLLWYGMLTILVALLYRKVLGPYSIAGIAALIFAINESHTLTVQWIANRYALITGCLCVLTLLFHIHWRDREHFKYRVAALLIFILSLFASEAGVIAFAYLLAYELLVLNKVSLRNRIMSLIPYFVCIVLWRVCYSHFGFGASATNLSVDPISDPLRFSGLMINRLPFMINNLFAWPPANIYFLISDRNTVILGCIFIVAILIMGWLFLPLLRQNLTSRFLMAGAILALIPYVTGFPQSRNLLMANIGAMALVAQFIYFRSDLRSGFRSDLRSGQTITWPKNRFQGILSYALMFAFICIHFVEAPVMAHKISLQEHRKIRIPNSEISTNLPKSDLILVNPPTSFDISYLYPIRFYNSQPIPIHTRILSVGTTPVQIHRKDKYTLVVRPKGGYQRTPGPENRHESHTKRFFSFMSAFERSEFIFYDNPYLMHQGQTINLTGLHIEITDMTEDGRAAEATFRFEAPLDDPSKIWLMWDWEDWDFKPFTLPSVNSSVTL